METRMKKCRQPSPERPRIRIDPRPKHPTRKVPVIYYLCRNRHLEPPHFIEVTLTSSEGLHLRDVINRLNALRGKGMATMYSWSCKRSYKTGFVWHDLSEDDLILPAQGNEYVLKGSELLEDLPPDNLHDKVSAKMQNVKVLHDPASSRSPQFASQPGFNSKILHEQKHLVPLGHPGSQISSDPGMTKEKDSSPPISLSTTGYHAYKCNSATDASTQTDDASFQATDGERRPSAPDMCNRGVSTDETLSDECCDTTQCWALSRQNGIAPDENSPSPSSSSASLGGRAETFESLLRADGNKINSFRIFEEKELRIPSHSKLKAPNLLMQLITCGSITVKDHYSFGFIPTYKPKFSESCFDSPTFPSSTFGETIYFSEKPAVNSPRLDEKAHFSGSLIEPQIHKEEENHPVLAYSASYDSDRQFDSGPYKEIEEDFANIKCICQTSKASCKKHASNDLLMPPTSELPKNPAASPDLSNAVASTVSNGLKIRCLVP